MSDPLSENMPAVEQPKTLDAAVAPIASSEPKAAETTATTEVGAPGAAKPARRAGAAVSRKSASEGVPVAKAPPPPDTAKTIAFAVCGLLVVAIVGVGGYMIFKPKAPTAAKTSLDKLSGDARELAEKAVKADELYKEGKEKAASQTLADLLEADAKLTEANKLFNEISDANQTVAGFKDQIESARNKRMTIDKELTPIRKKIDELESEERRNKSKTAGSTKTTDPAPPTPVVTPGKDKPEPDLSDANLDRLFKDDPSEYEKLAKMRKAKDPAYEIKKE